MDGIWNPINLIVLTYERWSLYENHINSTTLFELYIDSASELTFHPKKANTPTLLVRHFYALYLRIVIAVLSM